MVTCSQFPPYATNILSLKWGQLHLVAQTIPATQASLVYLARPFILTHSPVPLGILLPGDIFPNHFLLLLNLIFQVHNGLFLRAPEVVFSPTDIDVTMKSF